MKLNILLSSLVVFLSFSKISNAQVTSLNENFTTCVSSTLPTSWIKYDVTGVDAWKCSTTGYTGNCAYINGYSSSANHTNEDWLISPLLNLSAYSAPNLSFWSRNDFAGNQLEVYVSNNYTVASNPNTATWTLLSTNLPATNTATWTLSQNINLTAYKATPFRIAFKYTSTTTAAASWKIDEINIVDGSMTSLTKKFINVGQCASGSQTSAQSFSYTMSAISTNFTVNAPLPFQISKDNISFSNQLTYSSTASNIPQTVYVRLAPSTADKVYRKEITFISNGNTLNEKVNLLGTSLIDNSTLRVFSWNMRWFGSPTWCNCDTNLARINATQILKDINADVYCLQEIVSNTQIAQIAAAMGSNFSYVVSPFCTGALSPSSGFYQNCQKLGYIYNTNKVQNIGTFGLLKSTYPSDTAVNSGYFCFSSGRFPYIMKAVLSLNGGLKDTIIFADIHAKADGDTASYNRRVCATEKMTDSLNALFPGKKVMVIGDYNDYLEGSHATGMTVSPYAYLLNNGYTGISLPSLYPTQSTFVTSTSHIIDNIACTSTLKAKYVDSSFFIFTETNKYIADYVNSTSDHYPIMSYYKFNFPNGIIDYAYNNELLFGLINPSSCTLFLNNIEHGNADSKLKVYDMTGKIVYQSLLNNNLKSIQINIPFINKGIYFVELINEKGRSAQKWQVIE